MSIVTLQKILLAGDIDQSEQILLDLQTLGIMHVEPLQAIPAEQSRTEHDSLREALRYLEDCPNPRRPRQAGADFDLGVLVQQVLENKQQREEALDELELIREHELAMRPWGDFELPPLESMDGYRLWFYRVPLGKAGLLEHLSTPWKVVNQNHRHLFLVLVSRQEPPAEELPAVPREHVGRHSLSELARQREQVLLQLEDINSERERLSGWAGSIRESLNASLDAQQREFIGKRGLQASQCLVLQGWIPERNLPELYSWVDQAPVAVKLLDTEPSDQPPTLLDNSDFTGGGEEAVRFFQIPGYRSYDPSTLVFFSFILFFAMILADAGYALVLAAIVWLFRRKLKEKGRTGLRLLALGWSLAATSLLWGILTGSWFGVAPAPDSLAGTLHLLDMNDFDSMMKLSIGVGALHLVVANGVSAWSQRDRLCALAPVGWAIAVASGFLLWLAHMNDQSAQDSIWAVTLVLGLIMVLLFTSERSGHGITDLSLRLLDGFKALYGLSKAFGDVLSYMRLFALGLSSASLAVTFNQLAIDARDSMAAGGIVVFALILLLGHGLNFVLAVMSGVIHGMRLNLLEFYNWSIKGEGFPFEAFKKHGD